MASGVLGGSFVVPYGLLNLTMGATLEMQVLYVPVVSLLNMKPILKQFCIAASMAWNFTALVTIQL